MKKSGVDASEVELVPLKHEGGSKGGKDKHGHHVNGKGDHDDKKAGRGCMSDYTFANVFGIEWARLRKKIFIIMDQPSMQIFLVSMLLFSLYVTDAWVLGNQPDSNTHVLDGMLTTVFVIFVFEVVTLTLVEPNYYMSFFFFMDILGTLSIILDINFMSESFLPSGTQASGSILRATRTAKLGARYGRLMRILKLVKFIKYIPCLHKDGDTDPEPTASSLRRVTNELSNMISQRVAGLVMILVIIVPFLGYPASDDSSTAWMNAIKQLAKDPNTLPANLEKMCTRFMKFYNFKDVKLHELHVNSPNAGLTFDNVWHTRDVLRSSNLVKFEIKYSATTKGAAPLYPIHAVMDYTVPNQYDAMCGTILVTIVIVILVSFSASFQTQVEVLVVEPLEKMLVTLRSSATVMLKSMNAIEKETGIKDDDEESDDGEMETLMLEKMVEKLTRIIKLTYPGANDLDVSENVDSYTASYLHDSYSTGSKRKDKSLDFIITAEEHDDDMKEETNEDPMHEEEKKRIEIVKDTYSTKIKEIKNLDTWEFDVLEYSNEELIDVSRYLFEVLHLLEEFAIRTAVFDAFCQEVSVRYFNKNTYHNFKHGVDVMFTVYRLLMDSKVHLAFSQLEMLAIMTGALVHDVGHPGVNNVYLVKAKHAFALQHNDRSPLENMHCAITYEILSKEETNLFGSLTDGQWREARSVILTAVLGTDMSHHFEQISKTQLFLEVNKEDVHSFLAGDSDEMAVMEDTKNKLFVLELCLHCADVSNPFKPFVLCDKWAKLVVEEFSRQGDREKAEGLEVSPMCDREAINLCNMQMGFIEFVVSPLITALVNLLYPLHEIADQMVVNYVSWSRYRRDEIYSDGSILDKDEEIIKLDNRIAAFQAKFEFLEVLAAKPVRAAKTRSTKFRRTQGGAAGGGRSSPKKAATSIGSPRQMRILGKE